MGMYTRLGWTSGEFFWPPKDQWEFPEPTQRVIVFPPLRKFQRLGDVSLEPGNKQFVTLVFNVRAAVAAWNKAGRPNPWLTAKVSPWKEMVLRAYVGEPVTAPETAEEIARVLRLLSQPSDSELANVGIKAGIFRVNLHTCELVGLNGEKLGYYDKSRGSAFAVLERERVYSYLFYLPEILQGMEWSEQAVENITDLVAGLGSMRAESK